MKKVICLFLCLFLIGLSNVFCQSKHSKKKSNDKSKKYFYTIIDKSGSRERVFRRCQQESWCKCSRCYDEIEPNSGFFYNI